MPKPKIVVVELTEFEKIVAGMAGNERQFQNIKKMQEDKTQRKDKYGAEASIKAAGLHVVGCLGEMAVAKHLNIYWHPHRFAAVDVGPYQVRATEFYGGALCLHEDDKDKHIFISVYAVNLSLPRIALAGWAYAYEGKRDEYWGEIKKGMGREAFWMPPEKLHDMDTLMDEIRNPL